MTKAEQHDLAELPSVQPSLERITVRALSLPAAVASRGGGWSEAAKHRLYARMFPDQPNVTVPHDKPVA